MGFSQATRAIWSRLRPSRQIRGMLTTLSFSMWGRTSTSHRPYSCSARLCMCSTRRQCTQSRSRSSMCTTKRDGFSGKLFLQYLHRRTRGSCSSVFLRINLLTLGPGLLSTTGRRFMLGLCIRGLGGFTWARRRAAPPTKEDAQPGLQYQPHEGDDPDFL